MRASLKTTKQSLPETPQPPQPFYVARSISRRRWQARLAGARQEALELKQALEDYQEVAGEVLRLSKEGKLNEVQSAFWKTKPPEELYDLQSDRDEVTNLAAVSEHRAILVRLRSALREDRSAQ